MPYLVIIGDLVGSRTLPDRERFQVAFQQVLAQATATAVADTLVSPYTLTLGDEFQAVLRRARGLFATLLGITRDLRPVELRLALGIGDIVTALNHERAIGMDGSAFHRAREGIDRLKQDSGRCRIEGLDPPLSVLLNNALTLAFDRLSESRGTRLTLVVGLLAGLPVRALAADLGKSEQTLYKTIRRTNLHALVGLLGAIEDLIDQRLGVAAGA